MKNLYYLLLLLILCSCEKEYPLIECDNNYPTTQGVVIDNQLDFIEGDWLLVDGTMYMENLDINDSYEISHFINGPKGSLRYGGSMYLFEDLDKHRTVWTLSFPENVPGVGEFMVNYDSTYTYGLNVTENNLTVTETITGSYLLLGGSSRPIQYEVLDEDNKIINIYVQESYENINGYNFRYHSKLKFVQL